MISRLAEVWTKSTRLYHKEIWLPAHLKDTSPRGWFYAFLRVISITWTVFFETKAASRAAALSFSSLLGMGPLIAIAVLIGGFVLGQNSDPNLVANKLSAMIKSVAPQLQQLETLSDQQRSAAVANPASPGQAEISVDPKLVDLINEIIASARSGSAGVLGAFSLILIVLLLFKSIEDAFNDIWGVRASRSLVTRVVFYWTILTLGAVLFFAAITLLGAGTFINVFMGRLPFGVELLRVLRWSLPAFSFALLVVMLMLCYRIIPNTRVLWRAALAGALVVATLLLLNNFVAFLYMRRVYLEHSLYGKLGILPVLMIGLYIFWLCMLIGSVICYAIQNVHFRNSQSAWSHLTEAMRERLLLVVLLTISRRFQACLPPVSALQLSTMIKVPTQILNECLSRLVDMRLITPVPGASAGDTSADCLYQPARPLNRITLFEFKSLDDNLGEDPIGNTLDRIDPILHHYNTALQQLGRETFFRKSLEELLIEYPFDESRPPFSRLVEP